MPTVKQLREENMHLRAQNDALRNIAGDLQWMARRYADERGTYAGGILNDATRYLLKIGVPLSQSDGIVWARDLWGRMFDKLTAAQATPGTPEALGVTQCERS